MKIDKYKKLVCIRKNLDNEKKYIVHIWCRTLKQALNNGLVLQKVHIVTELNQEGLLSPYIYLNTELEIILEKTYKKNSEFLHIMFTMILTLFFLFFLRKILISVLDLFLPFFFFYFRKILISFAYFFFEAFLCFFLIIFSCHFLMKKNYEQIFLLVLFICLKTLKYE